MGDAVAGRPGDYPETGPNKRNNRSARSRVWFASVGDVARTRLSSALTRTNALVTEENVSAARSAERWPHRDK